MKIKIIIGTVLLSLIIPTLSFAKLENNLEKKEVRIEKKTERNDKIINGFEKRQDNIDRLKQRLASTTASTSEKKVGKLSEKIEKRKEQMSKIQERLINKELKVTEILNKIADKISERIIILEGKKLDMIPAKAKLAEADAKIEAITKEIDNLTALVKTEITDTTKDQLFTDIRTSQDKIKVLAKEAKALLVDTIKEITKVLPKNGKATTTATSTNQI